MPWTGYVPARWALFYYLYSFLGWVWESFYVSARKHRWVNRGFLNGSLLPIYGFGALSVLVFTLPVAQNPALVFFSGMAVATLLEYTTGTVLRSYTVPASSAAQRQPRHRRKNPTAETRGSMGRTFRQDLLMKVLWIFADKGNRCVPNPEYSAS